MRTTARYGWGDARGLSPVIGSILLVAIVVAGAAVVTTMFLGFGAQDSVMASIDLQYDQGDQGVEVQLVDRKQADEVEVRYVHEGETASVTLLDAGSRVEAETGAAAIETHGRVRWPPAADAPDRDAVASPGAANAARDANGTRNATAARFDEPLEEDDVLRTIVIARRDDDSSVIVDKQFELR